MPGTAPLFQAAERRRDAVRRRLFVLETSLGPIQHKVLGKCLLDPVRRRADRATSAARLVVRF